MPDGGVRFLHDGRGRVPYREQDVAEGRHASPAVPGEADGEQALLAGGLQSADDVAAVPGRGNAHQHVPGAAEGLHLLGEDEIVAEIVPDGSQDGRIRGQRHGRKRRAVHQEAVDELGGPVLGVRRAAAVARQQEFPPARDAHGHAPGRLGDPAAVDGKKIAARFRAVLRVPGNHLQGLVHEGSAPSALAAMQR